MTAKEILSLRLSNHQLAGTEIKEPHNLVSWMGAMQSQSFEMAKWGIGCRMSGITNQMLDKALDKGDILRLHILRPTWHFVSKDDIYWMLDLSTPRVRKAIASSDKELGLTENFIKKTNTIIEKALAKDSNLTRQELQDIINNAGLKADSRTITHIMYHAELGGIVCNGIVRGKKQTYALLEEKVPKPKEIFNKDESLYKLAYKYFQSHGPATLQDFIWWSGLTATECRRALDLIKDDFIFEVIGEQTYIFHRASVPTKEVNLINLLPAFDEFIVSYKDRKETLHIDHHKKIITSPGIFQPSISKDGKTIGLWRKLPKKEISISTEHFYPCSKLTEKLINKASGKFRFYLS
ncbi:MAG: winged helix DNA-binding domain-containing protein [Dysgonomonas sp.]